MEFVVISVRTASLGSSLRALGFGLFVVWQIVIAHGRAMAQSVPVGGGMAPAEIQACPKPGDQDAGSPSSEYRVAIHDAVQDHDAGRFVDARAQFLRAHSLYPNARTLRGLGMVEFELRNYAASVRYLEDALACQVRPLGPDLQRAATRLLARARAYVGRLEISTEPAEAQMFIDGKRVGSAERLAVYLDAGEHVIRAEAEGREAVQETVQIVGGDQRKLELVLPPLTLPDMSLLVGDESASEPFELDHPHAAKDAGRPRLRRWVWALVGVAVAAGATVSVLYATREERTRVADPERTPHDVGVVGVALGGSR